MFYQLAIALGSGLASAVLFLLPAKGSLAALFIGVLAPLPVMIATMGFGPRSAALAAATGVLVIAFALHPYLAGAFTLSVVVPAIVLGWMSMRQSGPDGRFTSATALLLWVVGLTVAMDYAGLSVMALRYDSFDAAVDDFARRIVPLVARMLGNETAAGYSSLDFARLLVLSMAPIAAAWGVVALAFNLWLAGRIAQISGRFTRPWPDVPEALRMPREALYVFVGALAFSLALSDFPRVLVSTLAAGLGMACALCGLAAIHRRSRGVSGRSVMLGAFYVALFALFPWPLVVAATVGAVDCFRPLKPGSPSNPNQTT